MEENKKSKKWLFIPLAIIVIIIGALVTLYFVLFTTPKMAFTRALSKGISSIENYMEVATEHNTISSKSAISFNVTSQEKSYQEYLDILNDIKINYDYAVDLKNGITDLNMETTYDNSELINVEVLQQDKSNIYFYFKGIFDKYVKVDKSDVEDGTINNMDDYNAIVNGFSNATIKAFEDATFTRDKASITLDGKKTDVNKNTIVINNNNYKKIMNTLLTTLKNDNKFISAFSNITGDSIANVKQDIIDSIDELETTDIDMDIYFNVYTKGLLDEPVKYEIKTTEINSKDAYILVEVNILNGKSIEFVVSLEGEKLGSLKVEQTGTDKAKNSILTLTIPDTLTAKIYLKETFEYNKIVSKKDVSKSVNSDALTEAETTKIEENLMKKEGVKKLLKKVEPLISAYMGLFDTTNAVENSDLYY